jgi:hypothetical protein
VDAADSAGAHETDAGLAGHGERPTDSRRSGLAGGDAGGQVARADFPRVGREALEVLHGQADADLAVQNADGCRNGSRLAHAPLTLERNLDTFSGREPVRDERRLEGDHGGRVPHLVGHPDHGIVPICPTQRAAASIASSGPPTR